MANNNVTIGFKFDVDDEGVTWTFRSPTIADFNVPQQSVTVLNNGDTNNVWVGINEVLTDSAINTGYDAIVADETSAGNDDAEYNEISVADALVRGICLPAGKSVTFKSGNDVNGRRDIGRLWMVCESGLTTEVIGGNVEM